MSSDAHLPSGTVPLAATEGAHNMMISNTTKKFIGAVEDEWQLYSDCAADYIMGAPIGFGASSIVYAAVYHPSHSGSSPSKGGNMSKGIPCALKVLDLDSLPPRSLQLLQRETTLMSLSKHPNVLRVRGSWMEGHKLYIALRLMNKGSAADVMRYGWPGGMEEDVVRCILRQALKGLNYLHINGFIHRDVKAANLLIDDDGTVLLGDLGVAADLAEDTSHIHSSSHSKSHSVTARAALSESKSLPLSTTVNSSSSSKRMVAFDEAEPVRPKMGKRKSFVGTPCWMAPELIQGRQYDSSADIWSFGITALELTQGRPPRSRESPQRVLLKTIQEDPPALDREGGTYKYSRAFKEVVDSCLIKDPSKRPTAEELLQTPFFKAAKKKSYIVGAILKDLPPLTQRQERRVVNNIQSANSMDSWDFATTIHSPTTSVYRRRALEDLVSAQDRDDLRAHGIFQLEEEGHSTSTFGHQRSVSWAAEPDVALLEEVETEQEAVLSSSPATSDSSVLSSSVALSQTSSPLDTSAPSSRTEIIESPCRPQAVKAVPTNTPAQKIPTTTTEKHSPSTPVVSKPESPLLTPKSYPRLASRPSTAPSPSSRPSVVPPPSASQQGLWRKLTGTVKRPSSRGGPSEGESPEVTPRKDKEKSKLTSMFGSGNMSVLSRASSRSLATGFKAGK
ncbi:kinase-like domain-containing protein [Crassisporium funariophilum]|nr:kinase-like domain-containing protein [Crassisporium funariophilum]